MDVVEGEVLVGGEGGLLVLGAGEELVEGFVGVEGDAGGDGVDEESDDVFDVGEFGGSSGDGGAEDEVGLVGEGGEGEGPGGLEEGVEGVAVGAGGVGEGGGVVGGEGGGVSVGEGGGVVGGCDEGGLVEVVEVGAPGVFGCCVVLGGEPVEVVAVGCGWGELVVVAVGVVVEEVVGDEGEGPAVEEEVVAGEEEEVVVGVELDEGEAQEWGLVGGEALDAVVVEVGVEGVGLVGEVEGGPGEWGGVGDGLDGLAVGALGVGGAEGGVALDGGVAGGFEVVGA